MVQHARALETNLQVKLFDRLTSWAIFGFACRGGVMLALGTRSQAGLIPG